MPASGLWAPASIAVQDRNDEAREFLAESLVGDAFD
jgi:hypothetical protein